MASGSGANMGRIPRHSQLRTHQRRLRHVLRLLVRNVCSPGVDFDVSQLSFYYTISLPGQDECIYTSEVVVGSRNPQWSAIHFRSDCEALKLASTSFDVCFWYSLLSPAGPFTLAWKQTISIGLMYYAGFMSSNDGKSYPPNTVFVETVDGFYCQSYDMTAITDDHGYKLAKCLDSGVMFEAAHIKQSCGSEGIQRLRDCANKLVSSHTKSLSTRRELKEYSHRKQHIQELKHQKQLYLIKIKKLNEQISMEEAALKDDTAQLSEAKTQLANTDLALTQPLAKLQQSLKTLSSYLSYLQGHYNDIKRSSSNRKRIMIHELSCIFPIDLDMSTKVGSKGHLICKVHLPMDMEEMCKVKTSSIALGFVAHSVTLLARILGKQLRFPIVFLGSQSIIQDEGSPDVTLEMREQGFPLYYKKDHKPSFCNAVMLLSNDIFQLQQYCNMSSSKAKSLLASLKGLFDKVGAVPGSTKLSVPKVRDRLDTFADMTDVVTEERSKVSRNTVGGNGHVSEPECLSPVPVEYLGTQFSVYSSSGESNNVSYYADER